MALATGGRAETAGLDWQKSFVVVSSYTNFDNLAHGPQGTEARHSLRTFQLDHTTGALTLVAINNEPLNPAFSRFHPNRNNFYVCTESITDEGELYTYDLNPLTGALEYRSKQPCGGTSTCYITIDRTLRHLLLVNYWDATLTTLELNHEGTPIGVKAVLDPKGGKKVSASVKKHVNHSNNDADTIRERQSDPHSHAIVLDPLLGCIAFVPDLGMDVVRQLYYDEETGALTENCLIQPGPAKLKPHGPRYIVFHSFLAVAYVVNELGCNVSVFTFDQMAARKILDSKGKVKVPTLRCVQTISTIPEAFPITLNTCGRVCVHPTGQFVIVSNRGHDSLCVYRIHNRTGGGKLTRVGNFHTLGATPRHFQFDMSGQWLICANQDTDSIVVFEFSVGSGVLKFTGNQYRVPSPNFVCCVMPHNEPGGHGTSLSLPFSIVQPSPSDDTSSTSDDGSGGGGGGGAAKAKL